LRPDNDANKHVYGENISAINIIAESKVQAPAAAQELIDTLQKTSPHLKS